MPFLSFLNTKPKKVAHNYTDTIYNSYSYYTELDSQKLKAVSGNLLLV